MSDLPSLVCVPVGRHHHLSAPALFAPADVGLIVAAAVAAGNCSLDVDIQQGRLPVALAVRAVSEPEAKAMAWQGRLTFEGLPQMGPGFLQMMGTPAIATAYVASATALAEARKRSSNMRRLVERLPRMWRRRDVPCDALFFPDTGSMVDFSELEGYVRRSVRTGTTPPFALPVRTRHWNGVDLADVIEAAASVGRSRLDVASVLSRSLDGFGPEARGAVRNENGLAPVLARWRSSVPGDSDAEIRLSVDLAQWNADQEIAAVIVRDDAVVPLRDNVARKDAAAWCRRRIEDISEEMRRAVDTWTAARTEAA